MARRRSPRVPDVASLRGPADRPHLLLNAVEFATRTREDEGASYQIKTGEFLQKHEQDKHVVGGEPDVEGTKIPEEDIPGRGISVGQAMSHIEKVRQRTGMHPDSIAGSWYEPDEDQSVLDASRSFTTKEQANRIGWERGEREGWDNKAGTTFKIVHPKDFQP